MTEVVRVSVPRDCKTTVFPAKLPDGSLMCGVVGDGPPQSSPIHGDYEKLSVEVGSAVGVEGLAAMQNASWHVLYEVIDEMGTLRSMVGVRYPERLWVLG